MKPNEKSTIMKLCSGASSTEPTKCSNGVSCRLQAAARREPSMTFNIFALGNPLGLKIGAGFERIGEPKSAIPPNMKGLLEYHTSRASSLRFL